MRIIDYPSLLFIVLFVVFALALEIGFRIASRRNDNEDKVLHEQAVGVRDGVIVLLSLLLGFTLAMALPRFDLRRDLVVEEANAIGTADLRARMLAGPARSKSMGYLRQYVDARLQSSEGDRDESVAAARRAHELQAGLWQQAVEVAAKTPTPITSLYVASLNELIDLESKRVAALRYRVPMSIWVMLFLLSILACLSFGFSLRRRFILSMVVAPLMISIVMALIADLDTPSRGFIRADLGSLHQLQSSMKQDVIPPQ
jgi:hypothetical protein